MSAPLPTGAVHLLAADDLLTEAYRYPRRYMALCGEPLSASSLGIGGPVARSSRFRPV